MRVVCLVFSTHLAIRYCLFDLAAHGRPIYAIISPLGKDAAIALEEYAIVNCEFFQEVPVTSNGYGNHSCYAGPSNQYGIGRVTRYVSVSSETALTFHR